MIHPLGGKTDLFRFPASIELRPFSITEVTVTFIPKQGGKFHKTISFECDDEKHPIELNGFGIGSQDNSKNFRENG